MRKIAFIGIVIMIFLNSCTTSKSSKNGDAEKQFVTKFLTYMDHETGPKREEMMSCISPSYINDQGIDVHKMKVNNYSIWGFSIDYFVADKGLVVVKVWGQNKSWTHQLEFKVVKEKGKLYLMPSSHNDDYIEPWYSKKTFIKE